jgi:AcrR family transcriptional regulator
VTEAIPRRRDRIRVETAAEIKTIALKHIAAEGTAALSLRAIAREMGMTAGAIYSYYDTRDELITALISDVYAGLVDALEAACERRPAEDATGRLTAWSMAYRKWAIANPEEFRLLYGDPAPGYHPPPGGPAAEAERRACLLLTGLVAAAWSPDESGADKRGYRWSDFRASFAATIQDELPGLAPATVALSLRIWGRLHGLISLEVYGHLRPQLHDAGKLFESDVQDLLDQLSSGREG